MLQYRSPSDRFKVERTTFYMLFIDDFNNVGSTIADSLDWAFCENEWRFIQFLKFFDCVISQMRYHTDVFQNCNWYEFEEQVRVKYGYKLNEDRYINSGDLPLLGTTIYFNDDMSNDFRASLGEFDVVDEDFIYDLVTMHKLLELPYFKDTEEFRTIRKLINRVCNCYIVIYKLMDTWYDNDRDYGIEFWFTFLPDDFKIELTKAANFPAPLEEMLPDLMVDSDYLFYIYIKNCLEDNTPVRRAPKNKEVDT